MTKYDLYKSITLFLLYQVPENTSASDVEIYKVWRNMSGNFLVDDTFVASLLEYVHANPVQKHPILATANGKYPSPHHPAIDRMRCIPDLFYSHSLRL